MGKTMRLAAGAGVALGLLVSDTARGAESTADESAVVHAMQIPRVRTDNPMLASLIRRANEESATFRTLMSQIGASDGIVWIEQGDCGHHVRACLRHTLTASGPNRLLRVVVGGRGSDDETMATLGHELRHAVEVLGEPGVKSSAAMFFLYSRIGSRGSEGFETETAVAAGEAIWRELRQLRRRSSTEHSRAGNTR